MTSGIVDLLFVFALIKNEAASLFTKDNKSFELVAPAKPAGIQVWQELFYVCTGKVYTLIYTINFDLMCIPLGVH